MLPLHLQAVPLQVPDQSMPLIPRKLPIGRYSKDATMLFTLMGILPNFLYPIRKSAFISTLLFDSFHFDPKKNQLQIHLWILCWFSLFLCVINLQALSKRLNSPTTSSTGNAITTSPLNTIPTRISGRNTNVIITLIMLQLALNAKPIIFPKIQKKNMIKSSDNMILTILS